MKLTFDIIDPTNDLVPSYGTNPHLVDGRVLKFNVFTQSDELISGQGQKIGMHWSFRQGLKSVFEADLKPVHSFGITVGRGVIPSMTWEPLGLIDLPDGTYQVLISLVGRGQLPILETITRTLRFDRTDTYLVKPEDEAKELAHWRFAVDRAFIEQREWIKNVEERVTQVAKQIQELK